jgi:uncharacterized repeat protein (TIGR03803 family)
MKRTVNVLSKLNWGKRACAVLALCATTAIALPAQTLTTLYTFCSQSGCTDGYGPGARLVQATNGDLYGTTVYGWATEVNNGGTVFKITPDGTLTTLHRFCSQPNCADGNNPSAGLFQAANGDFYGTTYYGGISGNYGTVFKITPSGTLTTLYSFCSQTNCTDGQYPNGGLVQATDGDFYGTTRGGDNKRGTVFKITPTGTLTTLYRFCPQTSCTDGAEPSARLVQATNGDFYGTTYFGGALNHGTVFKITPSGTLTTLYRFCSQTHCADGYHPQAGLVQDTNGDFYGTTNNGGTNGDRGTIFKITPGGTLTTLYSFCSIKQSGCADGYYPQAELVQATDGDLYGTTFFGGAQDHGTVFKITPGGTLTTLYRFCSQSPCTDGAYPESGLVQDTNGDFYGTTVGGGAGEPNKDGTVFRVSVGLGPFVKTQPTSGNVGAAVKTLGTNLTGATSVSFNGTAAVFTVVSSSEITTTVPAGASSGEVQVVTPGGTLSSNVAFRVVP